MKKAKAKKTSTIHLGDKTFILDYDKAEEAFEGKKVINGQISMFFNILPLRYSWAYDLYKTMKGNHWEPEDVSMQVDVEQWRSDEISDAERWIIKMVVGYFSAAEGIVGDDVVHVMRDLVTAPELKLVLGRHVHEENVHADSMAYMISSLGINPHECDAMFEDAATIKAKNHFVVSNSRPLQHAMDLTKLENKQAFAKNVFLFTQVMKGMQFYGLFGMIFSLKRQNKFPGVGLMLHYTLRDEANHIELGRQLLNELVAENYDIWTTEFQEDLRTTMKEGVRLEKEFIRDCLPVSSADLSADSLEEYIDYVGDMRLTGCNLEPLNKQTNNPFPWLSEAMDLKKENFSEGSVTDYQKSSSLKMSHDDDL